MAIADDFTLDKTDKTITYAGVVTNGIPQTRYTANEFYTFLQGRFDEPDYLNEQTAISAQTPTQYTLKYPWFMEDESYKALFGGSIQTENWTYDNTADGITTILHDGLGGDVPVDGDIGVALTQLTSGATGVLLDVSDSRANVIFVRNTNGTQFTTTGGHTVSGTGTSGWTPTTVNSGESVWTNVYSIGTIQPDTEIYIMQEDDFLGGTATPVATKLTAWWDSGSDYTTSPNGVAAGHIDLLVKVSEGGIFIDDENLTSQGRLTVYARQGDTVYSHFELAAAVGNNPIPFASTAYDINQSGFYEIDLTGAWGTDFIVGEVINGVTSGAKGFVTSLVVDTSLQYVLLGKDQTQFSSGVETVTGDDSGASFAKDSGAPAGVNGNVGALGITTTFGNSNTFDIDEDGTAEQYACVVDCNSNALTVVYEYLMFLTSRGQTTALLPQRGSSGAASEDSEFYRAVGDVYLPVSAVGVALTPGDLATGVTSNATGIIVAEDDGVLTDYVCLTQVKGTFDPASETITDEGTGSVTSGVPQIIVDNTGAPWGTFAGGFFFVARGIVLDNVLAADNNNWNTSDIHGATVAPPTTINLTFAGLAAKDRAVIFEVDTASGTDITKNQMTCSGAAGQGGTLGDTSIEMSNDIQLDMPTAGWLRIVDVAGGATPGVEYRYEYTAVDYATDRFTLQDTANLTGTATGTDGTFPTTRLVDSGQFTEANYGSDGHVKTGMMIENDTTGAIATVLRRIDDNTLETTALSSGQWTSGDLWTANAVVVVITSSDTAYVGFIDDEVDTGTSLSNALKFVGVTEIIARMRASSTGVHATKYLPFELLGQQITNADLTVTAVKTPDTIVS